MGKRLTQEEVENRIKNSFFENVKLNSDYNGKRESIELLCLDCNFLWTTKAGNILYSSDNVKHHHCPNCIKIKNEQAKIITQCAFCQKDIVRFKSDIAKSKSGLCYCSKECGNRHKNELRKQSGEWDNSGNYRKKAFDVFEHKCAICGWKEDERVLEVHHINENRNDNDINNLIILCPICHKKLTLHLYKLNNNNLIKF